MKILRLKYHILFITIGFLIQCNTPRKRPNIVYVFAEQWRASATGYAGDPNVNTPHLDKLSKESINFRNARSVLPACTTYRAALMTGRYPTSTGMFLNNAQLPDNEVYFSEILRKAGYNTGYIGKWHLDGHGRMDFIPPERRRGFEYWKVAECDHNYNHSHYYYAGNSDKMLHWEVYDVFAQTKDAQQFIRKNANEQKPFALVLSYGPPHRPFDTAPEVYKDNYPPETLRLAENVPASMEALARKDIQGYYGHCEAIDKCVGDLLAEIDAAGIKEETLFIFTSDHGEMMGSHGVSPGKKQVPWAEASGVPFLLRYPSVLGKEGRTMEMPLTTPDISATLLGLAGLKVPRIFEGDDLSDRLRKGKDKANHAVLYMGVAPFNMSKEERTAYRAVKTNRYTYVRSLEGPWLLYDDASDPFQLNNLVDQPEYASLRNDLDDQLQELLEKIGDDFRAPSDYIEEWGYEVHPRKGNIPPKLFSPQAQYPKRK